MFHLKQYRTDADADADADTTETNDSASAGRHAKLPRRDDSGFRGASASERHHSPSSSREIAGQSASSEVEVHAQTVARTRAVTACERCRSRKTRCDNRRPSCGYCFKLGVPCLYESELSSS